MRVSVVLLHALLTALFAFVFTWAWTDEVVAGSPYAIEDPAGAGLEGVAAGLVPMLVGLVLCPLVLWGSRIRWWWVVLLVVGGAGIGAVLGTSERFSEGMPAVAAAIFVPLVLVGAVGSVVDARSPQAREPGGVLMSSTNGDQG